MNRRTWLAMVAVVTIAVTACSPSESPSPSESASSSGGASPGASPNGSLAPSGAITTLRVQLPGPLDGEFAGYIAAQKLGYFSDENLTIDFVPGDPTTRAAGYFTPGATGPEFTIADVADVLAAREHGGSDLVDIAQIPQRSGTVFLTWKKDNIADACGLKGKKVGLWPAPADLDLASSLAACPLVAGKDYTRVEVSGDVTPFLGHAVDAIEAQTYDQVAQVLETTNPATGQQYAQDDIVTIPPTDRHATLKDGLFASAAWLAGTGHRDLAVGFVRAAIRGWLYCRDHQEDCVQFTTAANTSLGTSHTRWMINELNALIWPSSGGVGTLDPVLWQQTINVATSGGLLTRLPSVNAYDDTIVADAVTILQGKDLQATDYKKGTVLVAPGGK